MKLTYGGYVCCKWFYGQRPLCVERVEFLRASLRLEGEWARGGGGGKQQPGRQTHIRRRCLLQVVSTATVSLLGKCGGVRWGEILAIREGEARGEGWVGARSVVVPLLSSRGIC